MAYRSQTGWWGEDTTTSADQLSTSASGIYLNTTMVEVTSIRTSSVTSPLLFTTATPTSITKTTTTTTTTATTTMTTTAKGFPVLTRTGNHYVEDPFRPAEDDLSANKATKWWNNAVDFIQNRKEFVIFLMVVAIVFFTILILCFCVLFFRCYIKCFNVTPKKVNVSTVIENSTMTENFVFSPETTGTTPVFQNLRNSPIQMSTFSPLSNVRRPIPVRPPIIHRPQFRIGSFVSTSSSSTLSYTSALDKIDVVSSTQCFVADPSHCALDITSITGSIPNISPPSRKIIPSRNTAFSPCSSFRIGAKKKFPPPPPPPPRRFVSVRDSVLSRN